jgi:hypothetical protein
LFPDPYLRLNKFALSCGVTRQRSHNNAKWRYWGNKS